MGSGPRVATFTASDGLAIQFSSSGDGPPVVLVHSFGFDTSLWEGDGFLVDALVAAGRTAVAIDCRGHGASDRPHDADRYGAERLAGDIAELLDHLGSDEVDLVAFSMGSFVALELLPRERRVRRAVVAGVGGAALRDRLFDTGGLPVAPTQDEAVELLGALAPHLQARLADERADARALLAVLRGGFSPVNKDFGAITASVLLLAGTRDDDPGPLADVIPGAVVQRVEAGHGDTLDHPDFVPIVLRHLDG